MIKLYIDFDGVILNTTKTLEHLMQESGYGLEAWTDPEKEEFFLKLDWGEVIKNSVPLEDSLTNIQKLLDSNLYEVAILTHVNNDREATQKRQYLSQYFKDLKVIPVIYPTPKYQAVDCNKAILVDDYTGNLIPWQEHGGIPVKFKTSNTKYDYMTIQNLNELLENYQEILNLTND